MKKIITAIIAAGMVMSTATAISASAESTEIKPEDFVCTLNVPQEKVPSLFEQIQKWIDQITQKKNEPQKQENKAPEKPWLPSMNALQVEKYIKKNYKMDRNKLIQVLVDVRLYKRYNKSQAEIIREIRIQIQSVKNRNMTPAWNEDMIRFMVDFWDQIDSLLNQLS
jgi:NAD(P)H-dependent flavin oxidoreductase YrpB (nitropropane dioxygenase family)